MAQEVCFHDTKRNNEMTIDDVPSCAARDFYSIYDSYEDINTSNSFLNYCRCFRNNLKE